MEGTNLREQEEDLVKLPRPKQEEGVKLPARRQEGEFRHHWTVGKGNRELVLVENQFQIVRSIRIVCLRAYQFFFFLSMLACFCDSWVLENCDVKLQKYATTFSIVPLLPDRAGSLLQRVNIQHINNTSAPKVHCVQTRRYYVCPLRKLIRDQ